VAPPAVAPAARARPSQSSGLVVITEPAGARVTINGKGWGVTPLTIANPPRGPKRLRVSKAGYETAERDVGADTSRVRVTLRIELQEVPGPLTPE
jgi:hypothetical protein